MTGLAANKSDFEKIGKLKTNEWSEIVSIRDLEPGYEETRHNFIPIDNKEIFTHLRVNIYPDGGIARLRVYGIVQFDFVQPVNKAIDLLSLQHGGSCISFSNAHYGHPKNLIKPGRGTNMGDGWETARRLDRPAVIEADENGILKIPGQEWAIFKLATAGNIDCIEIDTNHFKGNFPDTAKIEGTVQSNGDLLDSAKWILIIDKQKLSAHKQHCYKKEILSKGPFNFVRITITPDGGISRVKILGTIHKTSDIN